MRARASGAVELDNVGSAGRTCRSAVSLADGGVARFEFRPKALTDERQADGGDRRTWLRGGVPVGEGGGEGGGAGQVIGVKGMHCRIHACV